MHKFLFLTLFTFLFSQAEISNIQASQRTDGSQIVDITYDLIEDDLFSSFDIIVKYSIDNGNNFTTLNFLSGDFGSNINPGLSKSITWEMGNQLPNVYFDDVIIQITGQSTILLTESPFEFVTIQEGVYEYGCHGAYDNIVIDEEYQIMEDAITNAQFTEFLITLLNNGELTFADIDGDDNEDDPLIFYEGDAFIEPGNYPVRIDCGITWNGTTFIVEEGQGSAPVGCITYPTAKYFADYYGARLPSPSELFDASILNVLSSSLPAEWTNEVSDYGCGVSAKIVNFNLGCDPGFDWSCINGDGGGSDFIGFRLVSN